LARGRRRNPREQSLNVSRVRKSLWVLLVVLVLGGVFVAWQMRLPAPQSTYADLQPAPDFTLNDQDGKPFTLSSLRGSPVVLVFYRGYW
jgi:cytochrome oxidase Cu insertion factor (SCO1/SenC/PrrC family)